MKFNYDSDTGELCLEALLAPSQAATIFEMLSTMGAAKDPMSDALRPAGTPPTQRQRQMEDAADLAGGQLTVTHACGGEPVLVSKADEPLGVPATAAPVPKVPRRTKKKPPTNKPQAKPKSKAVEETPPETPQAAPEKTPAKLAAEDEDRRAEHAQRWRGKNLFKDELVVGFAVIGADYTVVLELESGEKVWLDDSDNEIKRVAPTSGLPEHESAAGDFRTGDTADAPPQAEPTTQPTAPPADMPQGVARAEKVRAIVQPFVDQAGGGRGKEFALGVVNAVVKCSPHIAKFEGMEASEVRKRVVQVLAVLAVINHEELGEMKAEMGV
ncbi:MAG: hypothetical protein COA94_06060 [Rickettsiales bacterium]|nr:MAG: hypothetical protein COA94_06060 [Rickettsiales bacterium]